jgi:type IV secretory pathway VirB4 component
MTTEKLIEKFHRYLNLEKREQKEKRDKIRGLLKKLKQQQKRLEAKLEKEKNPDECQQIKRRLKVLQVQRKKGIKLCKSLKC